MVTNVRHTLRSRGGKINLGCLAVLVLIGAVLYLALPVGMQFFHYYQLREEFITQASFASSVTDASIRAQVLQAIDESGLPPEAKAEARSRLVVQRGGRPITITVETSYSITFDLVYKQWTRKFEPSVRTRI